MPIAEPARGTPGGSEQSGDWLTPAQEDCVRTRRAAVPWFFRSAAIFERFCSTFVTARQNSSQQVADRPTNGEPANQGKPGAAGTGVRSSAKDESGSDCDGESGERFVPDELVQMPSAPAPAPLVRGLHRRITGARGVRKHGV